MNAVDDRLLIEMVPPEVLLGLSLFIGLVAVVLFVLALEAGNYPELFEKWRRLRTAIQNLKTRKFWKEVNYVES